MEKQYSSPTVVVIEIEDDIMTASNYGEFNEPDPREMGGDYVWGD